MKAKLTFTLVALYAVLAGSPLRAFEELQGFGGLEWGAPFSAVKEEMKFEQEVTWFTRTYRYYSRESDRLRFADIRLKNVLYGFDRDTGQFLLLIMVIEGAENYSSFKRVLWESFGEGSTNPRSTAKEEYGWVGPTTEMWLQYDDSEVPSRAAFYVFTRDGL